MFLLLWRKKLGKCTYKLPAQAQVLLKVYDHFYLHACTYALYRPIHRQCRVKGYSRFPASVLTTRMHGAYNSYARCIRIVSTKHMDGEHDTRKISNRHLEVYTE